MYVVLRKNDKPARVCIPIFILLPIIIVVLSFVKQTHTHTYVYYRYVYIHVQLKYLVFKLQFLLTFQYIKLA